MRTSLLKGLLTATLVLGWISGAALGQNKDTAFQQKANAFNLAARKSGMMDTALRDISVETRVPQDQVQALHQKHPNAGASAILLAAVMEQQTKQPAEGFLQRHLQGKTWESIAAENKVSIDTLNQRLDHVQHALSNPQQATATPTIDNQSVTNTTTTNATAATGSIDQKVAALNQTVQTTGNLDAALHAISVETGVPEDQVKTLQKNHSDAGAGGVLIASVLADQTKQSPESFLQT